MTRRRKTVRSRAGNLVIIISALMLLTSACTNTESSLVNKTPRTGNPADHNGCASGNGSAAVRGARAFVGCLGFVFCRSICRAREIAAKMLSFSRFEEYQSERLTGRETIEKKGKCPFLHFTEPRTSPKS